MYREGAAYLERDFPELDYWTSCDALGTLADADRLAAAAGGAAAGAGAAPAPPPPPGVAVLGMHRRGTSALTGALAHALELHTGGPLLGGAFRRDRARGSRRRG